jgi:hypothetical protein
LLKYLRLRSWDALRTARNLIGQAEQALYAADVEEAIQDRHVFIACDRQVIRPNTPVKFAIRFGRDALNKASARDDYRGVWEFEHPGPRKFNPPERCWAISQYFPAAGDHVARVRFEDAFGQPLKESKNSDLQPIELPFKVERRTFDKTGPRLRLELVTMLVAQAPALCALLATAQDQVTKVSWYAALGGVFALGFGVDTLKNLLAAKN